jgi:Mg/Co/Ni transporter MgtE
MKKSELKQLIKEEISKVLNEVKYPLDKQIWNNMSLEQQNQIIDMMNKDIMSGPSLTKFDKKKDYEDLNSSFYDDLRLFLQKLYPKKYK